MKLPTGLIDKELPQNTQTLLRRVVDFFNGKIDFQNNISCQQYTVDDSGLADSVITIVVTLNRTPIGYIYTTDRAGTVYDYQRDSWTSSQMTLKCSTPNSVLNLVIF